MDGKLDLDKIARLKARLEYYKEHPEARPDFEDIIEELLRVVRPLAERLKSKGVKEGGELIEAHDEMRKLLTVKDAAKMLHLNPETVRRAIREKRLKASKPGGGALRISMPDLDDFYRRQGGGKLFAESY